MVEGRRTGDRGEVVEQRKANLIVRQEEGMNCCSNVTLENYIYGNVFYGIGIGVLPPLARQNLSHELSLDNTQYKKHPREWHLSIG